MSVSIESGRDVPFEAVSGLFERADCPCYCRYYDFVGDHRQWQDRCANDRSENRLELSNALPDDDKLFLVAMREGKALGFLRASPAPKMRKLYEGRLYRGLPCFSGPREGVWAVGCFLVDPEARRQGVARELLRELLSRLRALGAVAIESFPRGATDVSDGEQFTGPLALYEENGFRAVSDFSPYPVLRFDF